MTRILGALALIALIAVTALSGRSYRWCIPGARVAASSCCAGDGARDPDPPVTDAIRSSCCEDRAFGRLPVTDPRGPGSIVPPARLLSVEVTPIVPPRPRPVALDREGRARAVPPAARAGPAAVDRWKVLQVILC